MQHPTIPTTPVTVLNLEIETTNNIYLLLKKNGFDSPNLKEKMHTCYNLIDNYCHEVVYHKHQDLDYVIMRETVIKMILDILK